MLGTTHGLSLAEKYAKKLLGEKDIESVLLRLDRLTLEESRMTVAQTLGVVYSLVNNIQVVMEGAHSQPVYESARSETPIW